MPYLIGALLAAAFNGRLGTILVIGFLGWLLFWIVSFALVLAAFEIAAMVAFLLGAIWLIVFAARATFVVAKYSPIWASSIILISVATIAYVVINVYPFWGVDMPHTLPYPQLTNLYGSIIKVFK